MDLRLNEIILSLGHDWVNIVNISLWLSLIDSISPKSQPWPFYFFQCCSHGQKSVTTTLQCSASWPGVHCKIWPYWSITKVWFPVVRKSVNVKTNVQEKLCKRCLTAPLNLYGMSGLYWIQHIAICMQKFNISPYVCWNSTYNHITRELFYVTVTLLLH